jgi:hypothetical protein
MASFTDNILTFNPYLSQMPVIDEMYRIGMAKQQKYDQGVQKIQSQIDNVAGLDVIRDVDKQYLQSKMNELGNNLKAVAAGDFSNFQLVNSVGGMVGQLSQDPDIINAHASTKRYRDEARMMESARKEGKSSIQNQWDFNNKANTWIRSTDLKQSFNNRYTPYIDVDKKWLDVYKGLHSDLQEQDIPYEKNADGSLNVEKTAAAMQRMSKESVSAAQIENAVRSSLTPDEQNQLSINGRYQFRAYDTPDKLAATSTAKFNSQIGTNDSRIKDLEGLANLSTSNPEMRKKALDSIESLKQVNSSLSRQLSDELKLISTDPDLAKTEIYKNGAIAQFATSHAWEHNKSNILSNPVLEAQHWERKFALDKSEFNLKVDTQDWNKNMDKFDMGMRTAEYKLKFDKQMADKFGTSTPFTAYVGLDTQVKDPMVAMIDDTTTLQKSADSGVRDMVQGIKGTSVGQIEQAIQDYNSGDPTRMANSQKIIPVEWRSKVNQIINDRQEAKRLLAARTSITDEVYNSTERQNLKQGIVDGVQDLAPLTIRDKQGRIITFSPTEIANYITKKEASPTEYYGTEAGDMGGTTVSYNRPLTEKEKILEGTSLTGDAQSIYSQYAGRIGDKVYELNKTAKDELRQKLLERGSQYLPTVSAITFGSGDGDVARRTWEGITFAALSTYDKDFTGIAGGEEHLSKDDAKTIKDWIKNDAKDIQYQKFTQGNKTYIIVNNGSAKKWIPLTMDQAAKLPLQDANEPSFAYRAVSDAQYLGNGNTNPTGKYEDAYFNRSRMPLITIDAKADLTWDQTNRAKQYINLMLNTPMGVLSLKLDDHPGSRDETVKFIQSLTNEQIKQLYLQDENVSEESKSVIKNLK